MLCALIFTGCSKEGIERVPVIADSTLLAFMPEILSGYSGEGSYYHESKRIEISNEVTGDWIRVFGEVKDNLTGYSKIDFNYQINYWVDADKIVQTYEGAALNESNFKSIELLRLPIEKGNTWVFSAEDHTGKSVKVTGEIMEVSDEADHVVVKHSTKDGYYEQRDLYKGMGVTDFIRQVTYKNESTLSGYHMDYITSDEEEMEVQRIQIPDALYQLILKFEMAWALYVVEEDLAIFETLLPESNAEQKIKSIIQMPTFELEFVEFIPYEHLIVGDVHIIYVREVFMNASEEVMENKMMFTIMDADAQLQIIDFEFIK